MANPSQSLSAVAPKKSLWKKMRPTFRAWTYIAPAGLLMAIITLFPQFFQVWMSFTDYRIKNLRFNVFDRETWETFAPPWVGLSNFVKVLTSDLAIANYDFGRLLTFNVAWTIANVVLHVGLGIAIALALNNKNLIGKRVYRALFVLPWAMPGLITAFTWRNMYDRNFGAINQLIALASEKFSLGLNSDILWLESGTPPIGWLPFFPLAFYAVWAANVWLGWPFMTVIATGALQSIPEELYEAARIDGASGWQQIWRITLPLIRPAMIPAAMVGTIWTFNNFNVIYFITQGGPFGRTELLVTQAFKLVFEQRLYGVAAAFSIIVFFVLLIFTIFNNRVTRATEAYYE